MHNVGINATSDVLSSVSSSTTALAMSFSTLQNTLELIRDQLTTLMSNCNMTAISNSAIQPVCNSIPSPSNFQTEANFNNVSIL